jgi:hypothetical protein
MKDIEILQSLLSGNHLESNELQEVESIIHHLLLEYKSRFNNPQN